MSESDFSASSPDFEQAFQHQAGAKYRLRLYISGNTEKSSRAILNLRALCEQHLKDRCELEVVDIRQQPERARADQIIATPTLIKQLPQPIRRIIGDLSETERVLVGLDLFEIPR